MPDLESSSDRSSDLPDSSPGDSSEPAVGWWPRYAAHVVSIGVVFSLCKLTFLVYAEITPVVYLWMIAVDVLAALVVALLASWRRVARVVTDVLLFFYLFSVHYGLLFGGFAGASVFFYAADTAGMQGSILDLIRWPIVIVFLVLMKLHRWLDERVPRWLALNECRAKWLVGVCAVVGFVLWLTPKLEDYYEYRQHPVSKLVTSTWSARQMSAEDAMPSTAGASFDFHSKFASEEVPAPTLNRVPKGEKFNVIMISMESTGSVSLKREGEETMPFYQKMKQEGIYFSEFHAAVPFSIKSIFSYHSGHYPVANMSPITTSRPRVPLKALPEYFHEAGYRTALLHGGRFSFTSKLNFLDDRGYDILYDANSVPNRSKYEKVSWGIDDKAIFEYAKTFIQQADGPFYLQLIPVLVHHPYKLLKRKPWKYAFEKKGREIDNYHELIRYEDRLFEDLVQFLKEKGLYENTVIVNYGDHGEAFNQHQGNRIHSGAIYEENVRIPLLISNPKLFKNGGTSKKLGILPDLYPTLLDIMGWEHPAYIGPGVSLFRSDPNRMLFFYAGLGGDKLGVRDGDLKFIYKRGQNAGQLFNIIDDPAERHPLANADPKRIQFYKERALAWQKHSYQMVHHQLRTEPEKVSGRRILRLTDLPIKFKSQEWGKLSFNRSVKGTPFQVAGTRYPTFGFGTHANSILQFDIRAYQGAYFSARVGRDESAGRRLRAQRMRAEVWLDGEVVFSSEEFSSKSKPLSIRIPVHGDTLSLVMHTGNDGGGGDHGDWLEPKLELAQ